MFGKVWLSLSIVVLAFSLLAPLTAQDNRVAQTKKTLPANQPNYATKKTEIAKPRKSPNEVRTGNKAFVEPGPDVTDDQSTSDACSIHHLWGSANGIIYTMQQDLKDATKFSKESHARNAKVAAVMAQAVVEHRGEAKFKQKAASLRDRALKLAKATTFAEAKKMLKAFEAEEGKKSNAKANIDWNEIIDVPTIMKEVKIRHEMVTRFVEDPKMSKVNPYQTIAVLAGLGRALQDVHPKFKTKQEEETWQLSAQHFTQNFAATLRFVDNNLVEVAKSELLQANKTCSACHDMFKQE